MPKDCLNIDVQVGDFLFVGGKGNGPAQYGMQIKKVLKVNDDKIQIIGFDSYYSNGKWNLRLTKSSPQNLNKYLIHEPPDNLKAILNKLFDNEQLEQKHIDFLALWSHGSGQLEIPWKNLT